MNPPTRETVFGALQQLFALGEPPLRLAMRK